MKLRWLQIVRKYRDVDERSSEAAYSQYVDEPVLQYFDVNEQQWQCVDLVTQEREMWNEK